MVTVPARLCADHQGSIVAHANSSGAVTQINRYDEYGIPAATNSGTFQYTGQLWLSEIGMYHYKARIYSPYLGRFLQTDPVGYQDQYNLYAYVGNDPVNRTDPSGECHQETAPDGTIVSTGVCGLDTQAAVEFVAARIADENSEIRNVDAEASGHRLIGLRFGDESVGRTDRTGQREPVNGEMVEEGKGRNAPIIVTLDPGDTAIVYGHNEGSTERVEHQESMEERAEHAIVGHARDMLGHGRGQENSVRAENEWRRKNNMPFRRVGEGGRIERRRP